MSERVRALIAAMTLEEKVAQLYGVWISASNDGAEVAPNQNAMAEEIDLDALLPDGLGQLTRPFGTRPVDPAVGALSLARTQQRIIAEGRHRIPALAHDECLAGFAAWGATAYPVPLSWGATFSPELIRELGGRIGADMRSVGVHQGLAPVLDVVRDARWGRVEETAGEDPYLVGTITTAYIRGIEEAGVVATLKHFAGYSSSRAGRNLAPVSIGPRELADVVLPPFEMAVRESGVRSVMNSYTDLDGVPSAADRSLLTELLRDRWGFEGTVVADYFAIGFLHTLHGVARDWTEAARLALEAGIDVELPSRKAFNADFVEAVRSGSVDEALVDRALERVLEQKAALGLLDPDWDPVPPVLRGRDLDDVEGVRGTVDLDSEANRDLARRIAERAVVLLANDGTLPLDPAAGKRIAVIGPTADDPYAVLGCYSFPLHVGVHHPEFGDGIPLPTLADSLREEFGDAIAAVVPGTSIAGGETDGIPAAVEAASAADVAIVALGDRAGLFGRGTSGEGCDVASLRLPGAQQELLDAILATGTPVVVVLLAGRPYALGAAVAAGGEGGREQVGLDGRVAPVRGLGAGIPPAAAILEAFFVGQEGTGAVARILSGRVNPSGRLPVSVPRDAGAQPSTYLSATLARRTSVSSIDTTPAFWFGHGRSYTTFEWHDASVSAASFEDEVELAITVTNTGPRAGADVVQLYLHDPVASIVRPVERLIGYARLELEPGASARVAFRVSADLTSFTGRDLERIVEPGEFVFGFGRSAGELVAELRSTLVGDVRAVDHTRRLHPVVTVTPGS